MNKDDFMTALWEIEGVKTVLLKLQETDSAESNIYFILSEVLNSAVQKLKSINNKDIKSF